MNPAVTHGFVLVEAKSAQLRASCTLVLPAMPENTGAVDENDEPPGPIVVVVRQKVGELERPVTAHVAEHAR